jgi:hypothetical protein
VCGKAGPDTGPTTASAPRALYVWITLAGMATAVLILGWRGVRWWRRGALILAVPLCLLCSLLALNSWVGHFPDGAERIESAHLCSAA